ncbi:serine hydrolase [Saccharibacillus sacchari]|uniref:Serine hydrolase n=1 Tax=Saccharibacillus sacchari TaxID=456493 RepID=A0ACC6PC01_9BACL
MFQSRKVTTKSVTALFLTLLLVLPQASGVVIAAGASPRGPSDPVEIEQFADNLMTNRFKQAGAVLTIVGDGKVLLNKGYGYADVETQTPVDADQTLFAMASVSKTVTAAAVMQQVEQGKIELNADVQTYMDGLSIPNQTDVPVTMADLLTHTSGFERGEGDVSLAMPPEARKTLDHFIEQSMPSVVREPGTVYRYDNFAFTLQGYILEKVLDMPYEDVIRQNIFEPLGMQDSGFGRVEQTKERLASAYDSSGAKIGLYENGLPPAIAPSGGMVTTGSDMAKFMLAMLGEGDHELLKPETLADMGKTHFQMSDRQPITGYGFEFFSRQSYNGEVVAAKGGDFYGFHSYMWLLPEHGVAAMYVTNTDATASYDGIFQSFMDHYYPKAIEKKSINSDVPSVSAEESAKYEGYYRNLRQPYLYAKVTAENGILQLQSSEILNFRLKPSGQDLFQDSYGNWVGFHQDEGDRADYFYSDYFRDTWYERMPDFKPYADVDSNNPYADSIEAIRLMGLSTEELEPNFGPEQAVTRSEFVGQLAKVANSQLVNTPSRFTDVQGDPNAQAIQLFTELGGIMGYPDGTFRPDQPITREEAALMIFRIASASYGTSLTESTVTFSNPPSYWAADGVKFMIDSQLSDLEVQRDPDGTYDYHPTAPLLRQEAAITLVKLINVTK